MRQNFSRSGLSGFSRRKQSAIGRFSLPSNELGPLVEVVDTADLKSAAVRLPGSIPGVPTIQSTRHSVNPAFSQPGIQSTRHPFKTA